MLVGRKAKFEDVTSLEEHLRLFGNGIKGSMALIMEQNGPGTGVEVNVKGSNEYVSKFKGSLSDEFSLLDALEEFDLNNRKIIPKTSLIEVFGSNPHREQQLVTLFKNRYNKALGRVTPIYASFTVNDDFLTVFEVGIKPSFFESVESELYLPRIFLRTESETGLMGAFKEKPQNNYF